MTKRAYHAIRHADGTLTKGPVVVVSDENGRMTEWHRLEAEEPMTEWVGGVYEPLASAENTQQL